MDHTTIINKLNELSYNGFKSAYMHQIEDVNYDALSFEDRLYQLLDAQDIFLRNKRIAMAFKLSKIKDKQAAINAIDFNPRRKINKTQIHSLSALNFIHSKQNVIITGKTRHGQKLHCSSNG